jgi:pimeloyl-ACP methyl ester carboxylesterase
MTTKAPEIRQQIDLGGSHLSVLRAGHGDPVMLAHSYLWNAEMWRPQIDALSDRWSIIAPDFWGHGQSGPLPSGTANLRDVAAHHLTLLDELGIDTVTLVGLSVGGMWGAELALMAPHRVRGLVLMNTFLGEEPEAPLQMYTGLLNHVASAGAVTPDLLDVVVPMFFSPDVMTTRPDLPAHFREDLSRFDASRLRDSIVPLGRMIFERRDALKDLADLRMPTLVVSGAKDLSRPAYEGRKMSEIIRCPYIELPESGHVSSLETPDLVTGILMDFLETALAPEEL